MLRKLAFFFFVSILALGVVEAKTYRLTDVPLESEKSVDYMTFLLSEKNSGNTWCRYLIEYLTKKPTMQADHHKVTANLPLGMTFSDLKINLNSPKVWKCHDVGFMKRAAKVAGKKLNKNKDKLIFILRDYKECTSSHFHSKQAIKRMLLASSAHYFTILDLYDSWSPENKILILYSDLVLNPQKVLEQLAEFFDISDRNFDTLIENIDFHRERLRSLYSREFKTPKSIENGYSKSALTYHQKKLPESFWEEIDDILLKKYPDLCEKYVERIRN